ncbi:unnamed protein product [Meloidogyne enterolobii]|uniref:Uncharacterized protein n=1 Tax=Meloidogyne enterolobii TaxID=390850 RepID=A0ACB1B506_MELEN
MKILTFIFLFSFVTPIIGSGGGSSSKRGRFNPYQSSGTEPEPSNIVGSSSSDPVTHAEGTTSSSVHAPVELHHMGNLFSNIPFTGYHQFDQRFPQLLNPSTDQFATTTSPVPHQMQSLERQNMPVHHMKKIENEVSKPMHSKAFKFSKKIFLIINFLYPAFQLTLLN